MRALLISVLLCMSSLNVYAAAVVENLQGTARVVVGSTVTPVTIGQKVASGATVETDKGSVAVLKFDDGQVVAMTANSTLRIDDYQYEAAKPQSGRAVFSFLKGAMRFLTGAIAKNKAEAFSIKTAQATIGIRGTDFSIAEGSLYLQVLQGVVSATSSVGTVSFAAGQIGFVSAASVLPAAITAAQLPAAVAASFGQLGSMSLGAAAGAGASTGGAGGAASGAATGAAAGATGLGTAAAVAAGVAAAAAAASSGDNSVTTSHHH